MKLNPLKHVYKANQCTDLSDVDNAIVGTKEAIRILNINGKSTVSAYRRLASLEKMRKNVK